MYVPWPPLYLSGNLRGNFFLSSSPNQNIINMLVVHIQYVHWLESIIMQRSIDRSVDRSCLDRGTQSQSHTKEFMALPWVIYYSGSYFPTLWRSMSLERCLVLVLLSRNPCDTPWSRGIHGILGASLVFGKREGNVFGWTHVYTDDVGSWSIDPLRCVGLSSSVV